VVVGNGRGETKEAEPKPKVRRITGTKSGRRDEIKIGRRGKVKTQSKSQREEWKRMKKTTPIIKRVPKKNKKKATEPRGEI
jgi:hypothetical protein